LTDLFEGFQRFEMDFLSIFNAWNYFFFASYS
jgi:hypothetical protein